jgi:probable rRNA maturation factor
MNRPVSHAPLRHALSAGACRKASARRERRQPAIDVIVESPLWSSRRGATAVVRRSVAQAASVISAGGEIAVVLSDDRAIRRLNRIWRHKDVPTNVLSFPANGQTIPGRPRLLGDIVIAYETTEREARAQRKPFVHHLAHLTVHGFLHLAGYEHDADEEAEAMERLERSILARLDVPDPYIADDRGGKS